MPERAHWAHPRLIRSAVDLNSSHASRMNQPFAAFETPCLPASAVTFFQWSRRIGSVLCFSSLHPIYIILKRTRISPLRGFLGDKTLKFLNSRDKHPLTRPEIRVGKSSEHPAVSIHLFSELNGISKQAYMLTQSYITAYVTTPVWQMSVNEAIDCPYNSLSALLLLCCISK